MLLLVFVLPFLLLSPLYWGLCLESCRIGIRAIEPAGHENKYGQRLIFSHDLYFSYPIFGFTDLPCLPPCASVFSSPKTSYYSHVPSHKLPLLPYRPDLPPPSYNNRLTLKDTPHSTSRLVFGVEGGPKIEELEAIYAVTSVLHCAHHPLTSSRSYAWGFLSWYLNG